MDYQNKINYDASRRFRKEKKEPPVEKPKPEKEFAVVNIDNIIRKAKKEAVMKKAIKFGVVALGQAGGRIGLEFEKLGYPTVAINTSPQDLEKLECKHKLAIGSTGAGRDLNIGNKAVNRERNSIMQLYQKHFKDVDHVLVCAGSSGGTGGGALKPIVESLIDYKKPVGVLTTLPLNTEDTRSKKNTLAVLNEMVKLNMDRKLKPLILIDNDKIERKHPGLSTLKFWNVANQEVVKTFDLFNRLSATSSEYSSLDPADYAKIINSGGCMIFGNITVKKSDPEALTDDMFSKAISENINAGLLAEGFNLVEATHCGCIIGADPKQLEEIPRRAEENAMQSIMDIIGSGSIYRGVYGLETLEYPEVFFMLSGLGLPVARIRDLVQRVKTETGHLKDKATHRTVEDILNDLDDEEGIDLDNIAGDTE